MPGSRSLIWSPMWLQEFKHWSHHLLLSYEHCQGTGLEIEQPGPEPALTWDASKPSGSLPCCATMLAPSIHMLIPAL